MDVLFKPAHQAVHQHLLLSAAAPPAEPTATEQGASTPRQTSPFTRNRRLPEQVIRHRAAHLPFSASGTAWPVSLRSWLSCQRRASRALVSASLCALLRADADHHRQLTPPVRALPQYLARDLLQILMILHADPASLRR
jgi:hypothetical protein